MFSVRQKREIADKIQDILRSTNHPELPKGEIQFHIHIRGAENWSWADIKNNGAVQEPSINPHNEAMDVKTEEYDIPAFLRKTSQPYDEDLFSDNDIDFLNWIKERLIHVYGENRSVDFVLKLESIIKNNIKTKQNRMLHFEKERIEKDKLINDARRYNQLVKLTSIFKVDNDYKQIKFPVLNQCVFRIPENIKMEDLKEIIDKQVDLKFK